MENFNTNEISNNKNISKFITLGCLLIISIFSVLTFLKSSKTISTIAVTGQADISAKPDSVKFVVTRVNNGTDISQAIDDGTNGINRLINLTKEVDDKNIKIKKAFYQITAGVSDYSISNGFSVETTNLDSIDGLIKKLYAGGATTISNVTFESNDIKNVEENLRNDVYTDAKEKATRIAKSAGKHLGKVVSITDDDTSITSTIEDVNNPDKTINISKSASVVYKIW